jgi:hypothetical protein
MVLNICRSSEDLLCNPPGSQAMKSPGAINAPVQFGVNTTEIGNSDSSDSEDSLGSP